VKLSRLLPKAFGPADLGRRRGALPARKKNFTLAKPSSDALLLAALEAAQKSYAPYTSAYSGIALVTADGRTFAGSYIENAAFNPSLSPLQTAIAGLFAAATTPDAVVRAVLVEIEGAKLSQQSATRAALSSLAPTARLQVLTARV
jgi:cytidine deaminase